jgi:ankyrin repeat protein
MLQGKEYMDIDESDGDGRTALIWASECGHKTVVQMLVDAGADANAQGGRYGSALQAASDGGHEKMVRMLVDAGADVNAQGGLYGNALQAASSGGHEKVVQMLLDNGAEVNAQGGKYGNALQAASACGHEKVQTALPTPRKSRPTRSSIIKAQNLQRLVPALASLPSNPHPSSDQCS